MFLIQAVGKREDPVWSNPPKKHTSYNIFCLQYRHRYIQTQVLCCTDVLPPRSLCATQRGYHGTLGVFCHILYSKGTSSHRWESGERNFWLREGTGARSGICSQVYFAKKIPEAVPLTSKQKHDHQWTVIVSLHLHTQEAPKLGRHSVFPLLPQVSLSSKDMADNLSEIYTEQSKMLPPSGRCDCSVSEAVGEGSHESSSIYFSTKPADLKSPSVDGWEQTPGAWQHLWLLQQFATWSSC